MKLTQLKNNEHILITSVPRELTKEERVKKNLPKRMLKIGIKTIVRHFKQNCRFDDRQREVEERIPMNSTQNNSVKNNFIEVK